MESLTNSSSLGKGSVRYKFDFWFLSRLSSRLPQKYKIPGGAGQHFLGKHYILKEILRLSLALYNGFLIH